MRIQFLIADKDKDYTDHFSNMLVERYADVFEVSSSSGGESLAELLSHRRFDVALLSPELAEGADLSGIRLPLLLWDGRTSGWMEGTQGLRKYQRISSIVSTVLERCAEINTMGLDPAHACGRVTVVWSPAGGVGKTTAALAYAAQRVSEKKKTAYLNLEPFSSSPAFFKEGGKSISTVFERLDEGAELVLQSIRQEDNGSGICYFCRPDNYEDISLLSEEDVIRLVKAAASGVDELVVDLGAGYDSRTAALLELGETVLLVADGSGTCRAKLEQFQAQHELYGKLRGKCVLVANRGGRYDGFQAESTVTLPRVRSEDPVVVYKTLSAGYFKL